MAEQAGSWESIILKWSAEAESADGPPLAELLTALANCWSLPWLAVVVAQRGKWSLVAESGASDIKS